MTTTRAFSPPASRTNSLRMTQSPSLSSAPPTATSFPRASLNSITLSFTCLVSRRPGQFFEGGGEHVGLFVRVVEHEGGAHGLLRPERLQERLGLKLAGAHRDALLVERLLHVLRLLTFDRERDDREPLGRLAQHPHAA